MNSKKAKRLRKEVERRVKNDPRKERWAYRQLKKQYNEEKFDVGGK